MRDENTDERNTRPTNSTIDSQEMDLSAEESKCGKRLPSFFLLRRKDLASISEQRWVAYWMDNRDRDTKRR